MGQGYFVIKYLYITVLNQYVVISGSTFAFCAFLNMFLRPVEFDRSNSTGHINRWDKAIL